MHGQVKEIALGLATPLEQPEKKRYFLSVAGAGPDGIMVYSLDLDLKARIGILAYWWQGIRAVARYKFPRFRIVTGDQDLLSLKEFEGIKILSPRQFMEHMDGRH